MPLDEHQWPALFKRREARVELGAPVRLGSGVVEPASWISSLVPTSPTGAMGPGTVGLGRKSFDGTANASIVEVNLMGL